MSNPAVYDNRQRDGIASIQKLARQVCGVVSWAAPIIELKYRDNDPILALLGACQSLCAALPAADAALVPGGDNSDAESDPTTIPGTRPSRPVAPAVTPIT